MDCVNVHLCKFIWHINWLLLVIVKVFEYISSHSKNGVDLQ